MRRKLVLLAALAAAGAIMPGRAFAQATAEMSKFDRTMRSLKHWWSSLTREPDESDLEAKDTLRYVAETPQTHHERAGGGISITWIGHSTFLINLDGTTILTDPVFSEKIGVSFLGLTTIGLKRFVPPALSFEQLPSPDLVLVSHAHMDHYDIPSLKRLRRDQPIIMAKDNTEFVADEGFTSIQELDWGQSAQVDGVRVEALPARHWGRRYPWDEDRGYNALLITKGKRSVLFGGDTALTDQLVAALKGRRPEVAILPIGGYQPYIYSHASPEQAWDMFNDLHAEYLIPMHWRTFRMSHERPFEPYERLTAAVNGTASKIALHQIGETWTLPS